MSGSPLRVCPEPPVHAVLVARLLQQLLRRQLHAVPVGLRLRLAVTRQGVVVQETQYRQYPQYRERTPQVPHKVRAAHAVLRRPRRRLATRTSSSSRRAGASFFRSANQARATALTAPPP